MRFLVLSFLLLGVSLTHTAQNNTTQSITIKGQVIDPSTSNSFFNLMVVNKTTGLGLFGNADGSFDIKANKNDTIVIAATGYKTTRISFKDSTVRKEYHIKIKLRKLEYRLSEVQIFPKRDLEKIYKDIDKLGFKKSDYVESGVDALNSPITFLYQQFSKREKKRRYAYQVINDDKRRELLKELLTRYVNSNIIDLETNQFDKFIDYCNVSDFFLQRTTQYDFILFIKKKYHLFMNNEYDW